MKGKQAMSQDRVTRRVLAVVGAMSLFAACAAVAQQTQQLPPGSVTYPVHFPTGSSQLGPEDQDTIRAVASKMMGNSALTATIVGKADTVGSAELNEKLAEKRAQAVFEALVYTNKVPESRVDMHFTGERVPVVSTEDEQASLQNRVVSIILR
jgi:outer membrane protein OmpA-like peptidoglycan-associated protein